MTRSVGSPGAPLIMQSEGGMIADMPLFDVGSHRCTRSLLAGTLYRLPLIYSMPRNWRATVSRVPRASDPSDL